MHRKIRTCILLLLVSVSLDLSAQTDPYKDIMNFVDTSQVNIKKGRLYIVSALRNNKPDEVRKGMDFLVLEGQGNYINSLSFFEHFGLCLVTQSYGDALAAMEMYDYNEPMVRYPDDELSYAVHNYLKSHTPALQSEINEGVSAADANFMLQSMLEVYVTDGTYSNELREANKQFVAANPDSKYATFAASELPMPFMQAGMMYPFGVSYFSPLGGYSDAFQLSGWGGHFALEFLFSRYYFALVLHGGNLKVKDSFTLTDEGGSYTFSEKDRFNYFSAGVELGYDVLKSRNVMLVPSVSLQGGTLESMLFKDAEIPEYQFFNSFMYGFNLITACKVIEFTSEGLAGSYLGLRLKTGVEIPAKRTIDNIKGSLGFVELGIVFGLGDL